MQTDYGFKRIFGNLENKRILIRFLNALFGKDMEIRDVEYHDKEVLPESTEGKRIIYDIYCTSRVSRVSPWGAARNERAESCCVEPERDCHFILEMQNVYEALFEERITYYTAKMIAGQGVSGWNYSLDPVVTVVVASFDLKKGERRLVRDMYITDRETGHILTDKLRIIFLSLKSMEGKRWEDCATELERMLYLIKNMGSMDKTAKAFTSGDYEDIFKASTVSDMANEDVIAYSQSLGRLEAIKSGIEMAKRDAFYEGIKEGREEGLSAGREEGRADERKEIARNLMAMGGSMEMVKKATGLSEEEIIALKR